MALVREVRKETKKAWVEGLEAAGKLEQVAEQAN